MTAVYGPAPAPTCRCCRSPTPLLRSPATKQIEALGCPPPPHHDTAEFSGDRLCQRHPASWSASSEDFLHAVDRSVHHRENRGNTRAMGRSPCVHPITQPSIVSSTIRSVIALFSVQNHIVHRKPSSAAKRTPAFRNSVFMALDLLLSHPFPLPPSSAGSKQTAPLPNLSVT